MIKIKLHIDYISIKVELNFDFKPSEIIGLRELLFLFIAMISFDVILKGNILFLLIKSVFIE